MNQFIAVLQKELLQQWRNKQIIWLPLVFILLAIMDPLTFYFLPEILDMTGGLPDGAIFEIPKLAPSEAMMMAIEQINLFGILIILFIGMNTLAGERKNLIAEIIFVKPLNPFSYLSAKWVSFIILSFIGLSIGLLLNWYYVNILFGDISFGILLKTIFFYSLWFIFVISLSIFFNSFLKSPPLVIVYSIVVLFGMTAVNTIFGHRLTYFPNHLKGEIHLMIESGNITDELFGISLILFGVSLVLVLLATKLFQRVKL